MLELSNRADIKRLENIARLFIEKFWDDIYYLNVFISYKHILKPLVLLSDKIEGNFFVLYNIFMLSKGVIIKQ